MARLRILVIDPIHALGLMGLREAGFEVLYCPDILPREVVDALGNCEGLVLRSKLRVDASLVERAPLLRFVARAGAGLEGIDQVALADRGVALLATPSANKRTLAEHCLGMLLGLLHRIPRADVLLRQGKWVREPLTGVELASQTVGILGYGNMGGAFAACLGSMGCRVLAYDLDDQVVTAPWVERVGLGEFFRHTTVLSVHIPSTPLNLGYVDGKFLKQFAQPIYVLNTARGDVVVTEDLLDALERGRVLGAGLDVFEKEPITSMSLAQKNIFDALARRSDVVLTPHIAGWSVQSFERMARILVDKILQWEAQDKIK